MHHRLVSSHQAAGRGFGLRTARGDGREVGAHRRPSWVQARSPRVLRSNTCESRGHAAPSSISAGISSLDGCARNESVSLLLTRSNTRCTRRQRVARAPLTGAGERER